MGWISFLANSLIICLKSFCLSFRIKDIVYLLFYRDVFRLLDVFNQGDRYTDTRNWRNKFLNQYTCPLDTVLIKIKINGFPLFFQFLFDVFQDVISYF